MDPLVGRRGWGIGVMDTLNSRVWVGGVRLLRVRLKLVFFRVVTIVSGGVLRFGRGLRQCGWIWLGAIVSRSLLLGVPRLICCQ